MIDALSHSCPVPETALVAIESVRDAYAMYGTSFQKLCELTSWLISCPSASYRRTNDGHGSAFGWLTTLLMTSLGAIASFASRASAEVTRGRWMVTVS